MFGFLPFPAARVVRRFTICNPSRASQVCRDLPRQTWSVWIIECPGHTRRTLVDISFSRSPRSVWIYYLPAHFLKCHTPDCLQRTSLWTLSHDKQRKCLYIYIRPSRNFEAYRMPLACCSTSNRPRATGKILLTTCKAWPGSDRKGNQQRAKVTNTVAATLTSRKSLGEEGRTVRQTRGPGELQQHRGNCGQDGKPTSIFHPNNWQKNCSFIKDNVGFCFMQKKHKKKRLVIKMSCVFKH